MSTTGSAELWPAPTSHSAIDAVVALPGSKSLTNRYLVLAALADEPSRLRSPLRSRDTLLMARALGALGVRIEDVTATGAFGSDWLVVPGHLHGPASIDVGLAGTVMRFLPPVAALARGDVGFDGDPRARERPMGPIVAALRDLGVTVDDAGAGRLPFTVRGAGQVTGGTVRIDASASSQFVSALLLAGARFLEGLTLQHSGQQIPSEPHVTMTVEALRDVGVVVDDAEPNRWRVEPGRMGGLDVLVEPDLSNAAPFLAAAAVTGGRVRVPDWPQYTTQAGDTLRDLLDAMGAEVSLDRSGLTVSGAGELYGLDADLRAAGELTPVVAALAALAETPSHLRGIAHLRGHETDRLAALAAEINGLGGDVTETEDGLIIKPVPLHGGVFHTYQDHRLATAGALLGLRVPGVRVEDIGTTAKTLPEFPRLWASMLGPGWRRPVARRIGDEEDAVRVRPNPRGSRPRTKERPKHAEAVAAQVVTVDRGRYGCLLGSFAAPAGGEPIVAMKARELGRQGVVVGDRVGLVGDISGAPGSLARVVRVEERASVLRRSADDTDPVERVIVANADQLAIVTAVADPEPRTGLVDRCLVAAYDAGLAPLLALTKADLADPAPFLAGYAALDVPYLVTARASGRSGIAGLDDVRARLAGRVTVLVGHSGVGKSTLVNALVPGADRAIGRVNDVTGRGRHTSTSAVALALPSGGWVVDTPGIRSFGLAHVDPDRLLSAFGDLAGGTDGCPRGCSHDEPECGLDAWVAAGHAGPAGRPRLASYRRLLHSRVISP